MVLLVSKSGFDLSDIVKFDVEFFLYSSIDWISNLSNISTINKVHPSPRVSVDSTDRWEDGYVELFNGKFRVHFWAGKKLFLGHSQNLILILLFSKILLLNKTESPAYSANIPSTLTFVGITFSRTTGTKCHPIFLRTKIHGHFHPHSLFFQPYLDFF